MTVIRHMPSPLQLVMLSMLAAGLGCATPEAAPSGARVPMKTGSPKNTAFTYFTAIGAGDVRTATGVCLGADTQKRWTAINAAFVDALLSFDRASLRHFGSTAMSSHMDIVNAINPLAADPLFALEQADVRQDGDSAELHFSGKGDRDAIYRKQTLHARFLKKSGGAWKVDLPRLYEERPDLAAENASPELARLQKLSTAMKNVARQIEANKYKTLEEAQRGIDQEVNR